MASTSTRRLFLGIPIVRLFRIWECGCNLASMEGRSTDEAVRAHAPCLICRPQTTIATAMVLCHRFFLRRSHAAYDRFIIATSCLFLAAKSEETPRPLDSVLLVFYEICYRHDLANLHYRIPKDWFEQFKDRVLEAEQLLLTTLDFELTVQHPYKPLMAVFNKNGLTQSALFHVAWNLVNEGLRSLLWLQFRPHHIAAGAAFLAARVLNMDFSSNGALGWWQEFQTTPAILDNVVRQMLELYG